MIDTTEDRIREHAHGIWEREGRPADRAEAHWLQATRELFATQAPKAAALPRGARKTAEVDPAAPKRRTKPQTKA